jgi:hypothetical protein
VKRSVPAPVTTAKKGPEAPKSEVAGVRVERLAGARSEQTALVSTTSHDKPATLLLVGFVLGVLLIAMTVVVPASGARFTPPGRFVSAHQVDLTILGIGLPIFAALVYALTRVGP